MMNINKLLTCLNQSTTEFTLLNVEKKDPYILDKIDISCLVRGTYFINISDGQSSIIKKIIKN